MANIQLRESFSTFAYFFVVTLVLALAGMLSPNLDLAQHIGEVLQEHIAGKTILGMAMAAWFLALCCAIRNILKPSAYGRTIQLLIVNPTNFTITLALVAAAVNWSVALSSLLLPGTLGTKAFAAALGNALQISGIALVIAFGAWALHHSPEKSKTGESIMSLSTSAFWLALAASSLFWAGVVYRLTAELLKF